MSPTRCTSGLRILRTAAGSVAVALTLLLLSPGVTPVPRAAHADPAAASQVADGPMCRGEASAEALAVDLEHWIAMVQAGALAHQPPADDAEVVVLDNRGHNYRSDRAPHPALLDLERQLR